MSKAAEQALREEFEAWFRAAAEKDLDAVMTKIDADVVSYEHIDQLQHIGRDAVRAVCAAGFEQMPDDFRWDIPDLHVLVRGDIAVTWGLNRMQGTPPGQPRFTIWSRGTRIFQRIDGTWKMIHQHVSQPSDSQTGMTLSALRP